MYLITSENLGEISHKKTSKKGSFPDIGGKKFAKQIFFQKITPLKIFCAQIQGRQATVGLKIFVPARFFPWKIFCEKKKNFAAKIFFKKIIWWGQKMSTPGGVICSFPQKQIFSEKSFPKKIHSKNMKSQFEQKKRHFFILFSQRLSASVFAEFQTSSSSFLSSNSSKAEAAATISSTKTSSTMQVIAFTFPQKRCLMEKNNLTLKRHSNQ